MEKGKGINRLYKVLTTFAKYDPRIGYVQGMNFVVGALLWHTTDDILVFHLFITLMEEYDLREMFLEGLPGLKLHSERLSYVLESVLPDLSVHFTDRGITFDMFTPNWFMTLFCSVIPLGSLNLLFDFFFIYGWPFIYKFIIEILLYHQDTLLAGNDLEGILKTLNSNINSRSSWQKNFFYILPRESWREKTPWKTLMKKSEDVDLVIDLLRDFRPSFSRKSSLSRRDSI